MLTDTLTNALSANTVSLTRLVGATSIANVLSGSATINPKFPDIVHRPLHQIKEKPVVAEPPKFKVVMKYGNIRPCPGFVDAVLHKAFKLSKEVTSALHEAAMQSSKATIMTGTREIAEIKADIGNESVSLIRIFMCGSGCELTFTFEPV